MVLHAKKIIYRFEHGIQQDDVMQSKMLSHRLKINMADVPEELFCVFLFV